MILLRVGKEIFAGESHRKFRFLRVNQYRASGTLLRKLRMCIACQEVSAYCRNSKSYVFEYVLIANVFFALCHSRLSTGHDTSLGVHTTRFPHQAIGSRGVVFCTSRLFLPLEPEDEVRM